MQAVAKPLILAAAASGVERAIAAAGINSQRVLELAGVDPARITDPTLRLELIDYCRLFDLAARETRDDFFGARFGRGFTPEHFSAVGRLVVSAPTVRQALSYQSLPAPTAGFRKTRACNSPFIPVSLHSICDARIPHKHQDAELTIAALCGLIRHFLGPAWQPLETQFEHGRGGSPQDYKKLFGETVFDQSTNAILIDSAFLDLPMPQQDARAFAEIRALISRQLAWADRAADLRSDRDSRLGLLADVIERQCKTGDASIGAVARRMGLIVHGLRRELKECDLAYDELVLSVRQTVAMRHVESSDHDLTTIAFMLGYSELQRIQSGVQTLARPKPRHPSKVVVKSLSSHQMERAGAAGRWRTGLASRILVQDGRLDRAGGRGPVERHVLPDGHDSGSDSLKLGGYLKESCCECLISS